MPCGGGVYWFCVSLFFFVLVCYVILRHDVLFRVVLRCCDERDALLGIPNVSSCIVCVLVCHFVCSVCMLSLFV